MQNEKRYSVDFYDMIDGWIKMQRDFNSLKKAKKLCDTLNQELSEQNKRAGEHYGVIDLRWGFEIYEGRYAKAREK
jgi:hypothetical protein